MKNWCKIIATAEYDFLVICGEDKLQITFMDEDSTVEAQYQPKSNLAASQLFQDDSELLRICIALLEETILHYEN